MALREHGQFTDILHQKAARACGPVVASPMISIKKLVGAVGIRIYELYGNKGVLRRTTAF
jgi:hypothetical protein